MHLVSILKKSGLIFAAALVASVASAQSYDAYGQPRVESASPRVSTAPAHATYRMAAVRRRPEHRRTLVVWHRPFSHSLAIVGGSALTGAGVGALAGGPPGAIVGALTGGVGGLIYDRKTHKKRIVVTR